MINWFVRKVGESLISSGVIGTEDDVRELVKQDYEERIKRYHVPEYVEYQMRKSIEGILYSPDYIHSFVIEVTARINQNQLRKGND